MPKRQILIPWQRQPLPSSFDVVIQVLVLVAKVSIGNQVLNGEVIYKRRNIQVVIDHIKFSGAGVRRSDLVDKLLKIRVILVLSAVFINTIGRTIKPVIDLVQGSIGIKPFAL